jgi:hypothetical protein
MKADVKSMLEFIRPSKTGYLTVLQSREDAAEHTDESKWLAMITTGWEKFKVMFHRGTLQELYDRNEEYQLDSFTIVAFEVWDEFKAKELMVATLEYNALVDGHDWVLNEPKAWSIFLAMSEMLHIRAIVHE